MLHPFLTYKPGNTVASLISISHQLYGHSLWVELAGRLRLLEYYALYHSLKWNTEIKLFNI